MLSIGGTSHPHSRRGSCICGSTDTVLQYSQYVLYVPDPVQACRGWCGTDACVCPSVSDRYIYLPPLRVAPYSSNFQPPPPRTRQERDKTAISQHTLIVASTPVLSAILSFSPIPPLLALCCLACLSSFFSSSFLGGRSPSR